MFDKFGEFDSIEELNMAAEGLKNEGDIESLKQLAAENGIDVEDVEDYIAGDLLELATLSMAVMGRLEILKKEEIESKTDIIEKMPLEVILTLLKTLVTEPDMQIAIMKKGKRLSSIYNAMKQEAQNHKSGNIGVSCGTDRQLQEIIRTYYTASEGALTEVLASLYEGVRV